MKKSLIFLIFVLLFVLTGCKNGADNENNNKKLVGWDGKRVTYEAADIGNFGSATPAGTAIYDSETDTVAIWNVDASLDNYGGVQTPTLTLDFSRAVIFKMEVVSCYTQYIVKLAVEGESEYYYVLSDEGTPGTISINVVDAMLSEKYRSRNTQPDPGYQHGWKHVGKKKNCNFHILAKGPDGEKQTAELVLKSISVYNDQPAVTGVAITADNLSDNRIEVLKGNPGVQLRSSISPTAIENKNVIWASDNPEVASVSAEGFLSFVGVGVTTVTAASEFDRSKIASITVRVKSGFENPANLAAELERLDYQGSAASAGAFMDLFNTAWDSEEAMRQGLSFPASGFLSFRSSGRAFRVDNYFDAGDPAALAAADASRRGDYAYFTATMGVGKATLYRNVSGCLYKEEVNGAVDFPFAVSAGAWKKTETYNERTIVVWENGEINKYEIDVIAASIIANFNASDLADSALWTVPDRQKQSLDPVAHALSPASLTLKDDVIELKQNKYPEAKYCFGGILSNMMTADISKTVEIILDVRDLNQMNEHVKTMWEIKVIYYDDDGRTAISTNPLKIDSGNTTGLKAIQFEPAYRNFRIYLVVNGSDIGAQFSDAKMEIGRLKMHMIE